MTQPGESVTAQQLDKLAEEVGRAAAPAFAAVGWTWSMSEPYIPDGPAITLKVRRMMDDLDPGISRSSGRLTVWRGDDEDGVEQFSVTLDLGTVYGQ